MIYFISNAATGLVKIGYTTDPLKRLAALQIGSSDALILLRVLEGARSDETALHRRFAADRKRGEWFSLSDAVVSSDLGLSDLPLATRLPASRSAAGGAGRPCLGDKPMTATERSNRSQKRQRERVQRYEAVLRDLLAIAERDSIEPEYIIAKCREVLDRHNSSQIVV